MIGYWMNSNLLMDPMIMSVLYVWCQLNKEVVVNFWFGTKFKAYLLPWVLLAFNVIMGGGGFFELLGIGVGHLYFFVMFKYPEINGGPPLLATPSILYSYFPSVAGRGGFGGGSYSSTRTVRTPNSPPTGGNDAPTTGRSFPMPHSWGSGNSLGRS